MLGKIDTLSGEYVDIFSPEPEKIKISDIAAGLSKICRFVGQIHDFYSVGQHCCDCYDLCLNDIDEFKSQGMDTTHLLRAVLLHDASEAYCHDIVQPLKPYLNPLYSDIENGFTKAIGQAFNVDFNSVYDIIKKYDYITVHRELKLKELNHGIVCWDHREAYYQFMERYYKCCE